MVLAVIGCDDPKPPAVQAGRLIETPGPGSVIGKVTFGGKAPEPAKIDNSICKHAEPIVDETVVVSPDGGLANVLVSVEGVRTPANVSKPKPVFDQKDCRFIPHVIAVRAGQPLTIKNSDVDMHNVHATPTDNPAFNVALAVQGSTKELTLDRPEVIRVRCDVHPWMTGYIGVFESDYVAVTAADGSFEIKGLPAGSYELKAWHERFGELKQTIEVKEGPAQANFAYDPPR